MRFLFDLPILLDNLLSKDNAFTLITNRFLYCLVQGKYRLDRNGNFCIGILLSKDFLRA